MNDEQINDQANGQDEIDIDLYAMFGTSPTKERDGVWLIYGPNKATDPAFHVRRAGGENRKYTQILTSLMRPYQRIMNDKTRVLDESTIRIMEDLQRKAWVQACLLSWRNVKDKPGKEGEPMDFTPENVQAHMKALPELYRDLMEQSGGLALFRQEDADAAAKN